MNSEEQKCNDEVGSDAATNGKTTPQDDANIDADIETAIRNLMKQFGWDRAKAREEVDAN